MYRVWTVIQWGYIFYSEPISTLTRLCVMPDCFCAFVVGMHQKQDFLRRGRIMYTIVNHQYIRTKPQYNINVSWLLCAESLWVRAACMSIGTSCTCDSYQNLSIRIQEVCYISLSARTSTCVYVSPLLGNYNASFNLRKT